MLAEERFRHRLPTPPELAPPVHGRRDYPPFCSLASWRPSRGLTDLRSALRYSTRLIAARGDIGLRCRTDQVPVGDLLLILRPPARAGLGVREPLLELADRLAETFTEFGKPPRSEHDQHDHQHHEQMQRLEQAFQHELLL